MTEMNKFTLDNPVMYDMDNGRCRCVPIPYENGDRMTEKRYYLEDFKDFTVITLRLYDRKIKHKHYDWLTESHKIVDLLNELEEENRQLRLELDTHKHPLWSTREAERIVNELIDKNQELKKEKEDYMDDAIKFEKECKRLSNNLRLTNGDWKYEEIRRKELEKENEELKSNLDYFWRTYSNQEYGLDYETHIQLVSPIPSRKELLKENEQLKHQVNCLQDRLDDFILVEKENEQLKNKIDKLEGMLINNGLM